MEAKQQTQTPTQIQTQTQSLATKLVATLDYDQLTNCMRCGFCQTACPTFNETGLEAASPRGRIALMKAVADGFMEPGQQFKEQMDLCLGCRACEPACPSDVKYGQLIEQARESITAETEFPWHVKAVRTLFMERLFPNHGRMRLVGGLLKLYQRSGLQTVTRKSGVMNLFPQHMREMEQILPQASSDGVIVAWEKLGLAAAWETASNGQRMLVIPQAGTSAKVARVGMFRGCIMDVLFTETNVNTVKLLSEAGFEVVIPEAQTCCGALHAHAGEGDSARGLARTNIDVFANARVDYIASNAGGCGASLKEYDHLLHADPSMISAARDFVGRMKDVSELLLDYGRPLELKPVAPTALPTKVTYQDSCHLRNVMRVHRQPRDLIKLIPGVQLNELQSADTCCGSAGIYNLTQPQMSTQVLDHKMELVDLTQAETIITANPGCLLQMQWGIHRSAEGGNRKAVHLIDFLAEAVHFQEPQMPQKTI
ncbi:(Fe-S)-binding protein [Paenibacillus agricola]|uniref:(Fe-S)-binding protein n=1 Tax=Paenibacillus agricola TaxID=2716264 RepID=A0ABX0JCI6_9BACL|nr:(Fe-S)-binding protein [Paenibacillus agricola]NHN31929.1 (Fe-S)-binding protein [Paenibacillus agricola]